MKNFILAEIMLQSISEDKMKEVLVQIPGGTDTELMQNMKLSR